MSLLSKEAVEAFKKRGASVEDGDFGENLLVEGFELKNLPVGTIFSCNGVVLELTQIGKECHSHCAIHEAVGDCIMPREGVFAKVLKGGTIHVGDEIRDHRRDPPVPSGRAHGQRPERQRRAGGSRRPADPRAGGKGFLPSGWIRASFPTTRRPLRRL